VDLYLLVETRSDRESLEVAGFLETAARLTDDGHAVELFLVQNAVLLARRGASPELEALIARAGVRVFVDGFSAAARGLPPASVLPGVETAGMDTLVDRLVADGVKPIWH